MHPIHPSINLPAHLSRPSTHRSPPTTRVEERMTTSESSSSSHRSRRTFTPPSGGMLPVCGVLLLLLLLLLLLTPLSHARKVSQSSADSPTDFFSKFHGASDYEKFVDSMGSKFPHLVKVSSIGKSAEKRALKMLTIQSSSSSSPPRGHLFIMGGLHGREHIVPFAVLYAIYQIVYSPNPDAILHGVKLSTVPLVNPDGYEFSRTPASKSETARSWRKNRRLLPCKTVGRCAHGVDLNRNWGIEGKTFGFGATRATSEVFQGKRPFSEPENGAVRDWLLGPEGRNADMCLDVHCCAGTVLPVSYYHDEPAELRASHLAFAGELAAAMSSRHKHEYKHREREKVFSATNSGIAVDWIFGEAKVTSYIVEVRPGNDRETKKLETLFDVEPKFIRVVGEELLEAITLAAKRVSEKAAERAAGAKIITTAVDDKRNGRDGDVETVHGEPEFERPEERRYASSDTPNLGAETKRAESHGAREHDVQPGSLVVLGKQSGKRRGPAEEEEANEEEEEPGPPPLFSSSAESNNDAEDLPPPPLEPPLESEMTNPPNRTPPEEEPPPVPPLHEENVAPLEHIITPLDENERTKPKLMVPASEDEFDTPASSSLETEKDDENAHKGASGTMDPIDSEINVIMREVLTKETTDLGEIDDGGDDVEPIPAKPAELVMDEDRPEDDPLDGIMNAEEPVPMFSDNEPPSHRLRNAAATIADQHRTQHQSNHARGHDFFEATRHKGGDPRARDWRQHLASQLFGPLALSFCALILWRFSRSSSAGSVSVPVGPPHASSPPPPTNGVGAIHPAHRHSHPSFVRSISATSPSPTTSSYVVVRKRAIAAASSSYSTGPAGSATGGNASGSLPPVPAASSVPHLNTAGGGPFVMGAGNGTSVGGAYPIPSPTSASSASSGASFVSVPHGGGVAPTSSSIALASAGLATTGLLRYLPNGSSSSASGGGAFSKHHD